MRAQVRFARFVNRDDGERQPGCFDGFVAGELELFAQCFFRRKVFDRSGEVVIGAFIACCEGGDPG